jgi:hypothetical protein
MHIFFNKKRIYILILSFLWIFAAVIINPKGEFSLNDDWAYSKTVFNLSENGILKFGDWPAMTLIAQTLWGALFCKIFGFSFTILRLSVLLLGWLGVITVFVLIVKLTQNYILSFISALTIAFNPLFFSLSCTFMTDVPFIVTLLVSAYFYSCYFTELKIKFVIIASLFALLATMIRQLGLWIPVTFVLTYVISTKINIKHLILFCFSALLIIIIFITYSWLLKYYKLLPSNYNSIYKFFFIKSLPETLNIVYFRINILLFYCGSFLLPLEIYIFPYLWKNMNLKNRITGLVISIILSFPIIFHYKNIPNGNVLYNFGLGPKVLKDTYWGYNFHPILPNEIMWFIYIIGTLGAMLLVFSLYTLYHDFKTNRDNVPIRKVKNQSLFIVIGYLFFLLKGPNFFDRYFITLIPFLAVLILFPDIKSNILTRVISFSILICFALFSIAATHDYLSWNRSKWKGLTELNKMGIPPSKIDGGIEFNGWYETAKIYTGENINRSWWFVKDDEYVIGFGNIYGYDNIGSVKYKSYLTSNDDSIVLMQRKSGFYDTTIIFCDAENVTKDGSCFLASNSNLLLQNAVSRTKIDSKAGSYSLLLDKNQPYGFTIELPDIRSYKKIHVKVWSKYCAGQASLVITSPESEYFYKSFNIIQKDINNWQLFECETKIPSDYRFSGISIFIWNHGTEKALFDDFTILLLKESIHKRITIL